MLRLDVAMNRCDRNHNHGCGQGLFEARPFPISNSSFMAPLRRIDAYQRTLWIMQKGPEHCPAQGRLMAASYRAAACCGPAYGLNGPSAHTWPVRITRMPTAFEHI